jgi:hypothetical protein
MVYKIQGVRYWYKWFSRIQGLTGLRCDWRYWCSKNSRIKGDKGILGHKEFRDQQDLLEQMG